MAFSDDGKTIMDTGVMRRTSSSTPSSSGPVIVHAEDRTLVGDGVVNEGAVSTRLGLPGNPGGGRGHPRGPRPDARALTGARLHVAHVSSAARSP